MRFLIFLIILFLSFPCLNSQAATSKKVTPPKYDENNLKPEEVLVLANKGSQKSIEVAKYYMKKRGVPEKNLLLLDFTGYRHPGWISFDDFMKKGVKPLRKFLETKKMKNKILCFLLSYDMPLRVQGPKFTAEEKEEMTKKQEARYKNSKDAAKYMKWWKRQTFELRASFGSELAWLYRPKFGEYKANDVNYKKLFSFWIRNPYSSRPYKFREYRKQQLKNDRSKDTLMYMVSRLEGPSVAIAKGLVDSAMKAEKDGPKGAGYFDSRKKTIGLKKTGYDTGNYWARWGYIHTKNAGFKAVLDEKKDRFTTGQCPDALFYWGWYKLTGYEDVFNSKFAPGAIAVHTASGEASNLRKSGGPWCSGFLTHGAAVCMGPVAEPYLTAFPNAERFYPAIMKGWSIAEAYWTAVDHVSWMMVLVGDPLYAPFAGKNTLKTYITGGRITFTPSGQKNASTSLYANDTANVTVEIKSLHPLFKESKAYKMIDPGTNDKNIELINLAKAKFKIKDSKTLVVSGFSVKLGKFGKYNKAELELHIDLGVGIGKKIISQSFYARTKPQKK